MQGNNLHCGLASGSASGNPCITGASPISHCKNCIILDTLIIAYNEIENSVFNKVDLQNIVYIREQIEKFTGRKIEDVIKTLNGRGRFECRHNVINVQP